MWVQLKFSVFGREVWSLELDKCPALEETEFDEGFFDEEPEECEDDDEEKSPYYGLRWGETACFSPTE